MLFQVIMAKPSGVLQCGRYCTEVYIPVHSTIFFIYLYNNTMS